MSTSPRHTTTLSTAARSQPGSSFQNPLRSVGARAHPNAEYFYVLDRAQGIIQVIGQEARDYCELGYGVFDGYGNQVKEFDNAHAAAVTGHAAADYADAFYYQIDGIWELIDMAQAMADAAADETVHYDLETGRWYKKKIIEAPQDTKHEDHGRGQASDTPDTASSAVSSSQLP
jgi:hypothetical protein